MHSIRVKIIAITIAAVLLSLLSVYAVFNLNIHQETDVRSVEMMNLLNQEKRDSLEKYFASIEQSVEMAANIASDSLDNVVLIENGAIGTYVSKDEQTEHQRAILDEYLGGHCDKIQEAFASVASRTYGVVTYYYCIMPEISQTEHGIFYSKVGRSSFAEEAPLDISGLDLTDREHYAWIVDPITRGRPSWVGPYKGSFIDDLYICSYLVPIYKSGTLIGILGMDIPVDTLISQIEDTRVYNTGYAVLLDAEGRVIYHPTETSGIVPELSGISFREDVLEKSDSGDSLLRYTFGGEEKQMAFSTLQNGMKLIIVAPVSEINASWTHMSSTLLLMTIIIIICISLIILFVMSFITKPMKQLTEASERLSAGDYDVELGYKSKDEIGKLTDAFVQMRDRIKADIDDLNMQVKTSALTGLPNMKYFFELAEDRRREINEEGGRPAVLYFNLAGMKHYNREYGFTAGDELIRDIAGILKDHYGETSVCHVSQDHFAAVTGEPQTDQVLRSLFLEVRKAGGGLSLPIRAGVYDNWPEDISAGTACDRAKYACDQLRGNYVSGYCRFDDSMLKRLENTRYIMDNLGRALKEHWVQAYYQPVVSADDMNVCEEEALTRWIDPERGMLSPAEFVPILEDARLIYRLDLYMLDQILEKLRGRKLKGEPLVAQSLNLSRSDFDSKDMVEEIRRRVDDAGISRDLINIEITESIVGSDFEFIKKEILRFQELGFSVWMDDFGSGYSSLDVLQEIHFDVIKFDMRFIQRFEEGQESRIILKELIQMVRDLNMETVCEGVETKEQAEFLRECGCTRLQGYYFGKPAPYIKDNNR